MLDAVAVAWFGIWNVPGGTVPTVTWNVSVAEALAASVPRFQTTLPEDRLHVPKGFVQLEATYAVLAGTGSVTTTFVAATPDSLLTRSV